jgi:hypothetical protein
LDKCSIVEDAEVQEYPRQDGKMNSLEDEEEFEVLTYCVTVGWSVVWRWGDDSGDGNALPREEIWMVIVRLGLTT